MCLHGEIFPSKSLNNFPYEHFSRLNTYLTPFQYLTDSSNMLDDMLRFSNLCFEIVEQVKSKTNLNEKIDRAKKHFNNSEYG